MQHQMQDEPKDVRVQICISLAMYLPAESRLGMHTAMDKHCAYMWKCHTQSALIHHSGQTTYVTHTAVELGSLSHIHTHRLS